MEDGSVGAGLDARGEGDVDGRLGGDHVHAHQLGDAPGIGNRGSPGGAQDEAEVAITLPRVPDTQSWTAH